MDSETEPWSSGRQLLLKRCKTRALSCLNDHEYKRAFAHFIVALTVEPSVKGELLNAFLFTLEKIADDLEKEAQVNEILMCYQQALDVLPHDAHILHGLASALFRLGYVECAASYFLKSYQANPFFTSSLFCMENLKNALVERWHFIMLNDSERNLAYQMSIKKAVESGYRSVLDVGAGTGIFSMMALDSGAEKVYACEGSEIMSAVLQSVCEVNNKSIEVIPYFSTDITTPEILPEKVSLIVTEIFDAGLFGENSLETLNHAWDQLLQISADSEPSNPENNELNADLSPSGDVHMNGENSSSHLQSRCNIAKIIPYSATVYAVPLECEHFRKSLRLDNTIINALDINRIVVPQFLDEEPYSADKLNNVPGGYKMLGTPLVLLEANFNSPQEIKCLLEGKNYDLVFTCTTSGNLDAFAVWFELHLDDEITISTAPNSSDSCCWEQAIFYALPQHLKGSPVCKIGNNIEAHFLCQGHLQLKSIHVMNEVQEPLLLSSQSLVMDPSLIYLLNSYNFGNIINLDLRDISAVDNACILDISTFPVLSLKHLQNNSSTATVLRTQYQGEIEQIQHFHHIPYEKLMFTSYEELYNTKMQCDLLIVDPVQRCGLLQKNLLEDIMMLRMRCLKDSGLVVPGEIEIYAILVESSTLLEQSRVLSDEKTAGYKISEIINAYQCWIHQDIELSTLHHKKLSEPVKLSQINLNNTSEQERKSLFSSTCKTAEMEIINSGTVHAVIYWFTVKYHPQFCINTSDPNSLWKQAAFIVEKEMDVAKGEKVHVQWNLKNGCLQIGFYDKESTVLN